MDGEVLYKYRTIFWPIILWPYYKHSHTIQVIGWKDKRPYTIKNVKMSFAGTLIVTKDYMKISHVLLGRWMSITIQNKDIESIHPYAEDSGLLEVVFRQANMGKLITFFLRGAPENRILLNLKGSHRKLLEKRKEEIVT